MRLLRLIVVLMFAASASAAVAFQITYEQDATKPQLTVHQKQIQAPCSVTNEQLLEYVSAYDEKDGDLTDRVFVESISQFIEQGVCSVTFCVEDNDRNIAKASATLVYTDYEPPELTLDSSLLYTESRPLTLQGEISVHDKLDGDITSMASIVAGEESAGAQSYPIDVRVINSKGFIYQWELNAHEVQSYEYNPSYALQLDNHLIVVDEGGELPDVSEMLGSVTYLGKKLDNAEVRINTRQVDLTTPGTYSIWLGIYTVSGGNGSSRVRTRVSTERIIVICREVSQ